MSTDFVCESDILVGIAVGYQAKIMFGILKIGLILFINLPLTAAGGAAKMA